MLSLYVLCCCISWNGGVRLRDISQENEREHRRRIAELEKDVDGFDEIQGESHCFIVGVCLNGII